jgi:hypothetical protein
LAPVAFGQRHCELPDIAWMHKLRISIDIIPGNCPDAPPPLINSGDGFNVEMGQSRLGPANVCNGVTFR